jgi:hypothetical protein
LGPILENSLRQSLLISQGSISIFTNQFHPMPDYCPLDFDFPILLRKIRQMKARIS